MSKKLIMATANKKKSEQQHTLIPLVKWINTELPPLPLAPPATVNATALSRHSSTAAAASGQNNGAAHNSNTAAAVNSINNSANNSSNSSDSRNAYSSSRNSSGSSNNRWQ